MYLIGRVCQRSFFTVNLVFDWCYTIMCVYYNYLGGTPVEAQVPVRG